MITNAAHREHRWLEVLVILLFIVPPYVWISAHAYSISGFTDAMDYLFIADFYRSMLAGQPDGVAAAQYIGTRFPPLFPLLLGSLGAGSDAVQWATAISNATAVLAVLATWAWVRRERHSRLSAAVVALAFGLYPAYWLLNLYPVSEPLAAVFLYAILAMLSRGSPSASRLLVAGLLIGISLLARTALIPLVPAFALWLALGKPQPWRRMLLPVLLTLTPWATWSLYRHAMGADSYLSHLAGGALSTYADVGIALAWQLPWRTFQAFVDNWFVEDSILALAASTLIAGFALVGCAVRMRKNRLDAWFLAAYLVMIAVWPFPDELGRFLVVVYPCILLCAVEGADVIWSTISDRGPHRKQRLQPAMALLAGAVLAGMLPAASQFVHRATLSVDLELRGDQRETVYFLAPTDAQALRNAEISARIRLTAEETAKLVPKGECVYSTMPQLLQLQGGVIGVLYPRGIDSVEAARRELRECRYFFLSGLNAVQLDVPALYPFEGLKGWVRPLLESTMTYEGKLFTAAALLQSTDP